MELLADDPKNSMTRTLKLFIAVEEKRMILNVDKCGSCLKEISKLGHVVSEGSMQPDPATESSEVVSGSKQFNSIQSGSRIRTLLEVQKQDASPSSSAVITRINDIKS